MSVIMIMGHPMGAGTVTTGKPKFGWNKAWANWFFLDLTGYTPTPPQSQWVAYIS